MKSEESSKNNEKKKCLKIEFRALLKEKNECAKSIIFKKEGKERNVQSLNVTYVIIKGRM